MIEPCGKGNDMDGSKSVKSLDGASPTPAEGESSDSDGDTEPAKSFHRRWSTNREINNSVRFRVFFFLVLICVIRLQATLLCSMSRALKIMVDTHNMYSTFCCCCCCLIL